MLSVCIFYLYSLWYITFHPASAPSSSSLFRTSPCQNNDRFKSCWINCHYSCRQSAPLLSIPASSKQCESLSQKLHSHLDGKQPPWTMFIFSEWQWLNLTLPTLGWISSVAALPGALIWKRRVVEIIHGPNRWTEVTKQLPEGECKTSRP